MSPIMPPYISLLSAMHPSRSSRLVILYAHSSWTCHPASGCNGSNNHMAVVCCRCPTRAC